jgi:uncharacterized membrane protein YfcA
MPVSVSGFQLHCRSCLVGLVAGLGGGLFSLGGGTLTIPLLLRWLGLSAFQARGTALAAALFPATLGAVLYHQAGRVDWGAVVLIAVPALLTAPLIGLWSERLAASRLQRIFGAVVISGALLLALRDQLLGNWVVSGTTQTAYLIGTGIIEGLVAGSVGIGGGPILAPLLVLGLGIPQQLAQGCSLAARVPAVVTGSLENLRHGHICLPLMPGLVTGGLVGAWLGSRAALSLPELHLRSLFAIFLLLLGTRYLLRKNYP